MPCDGISRAFEMLFEWGCILAVIARLDRTIQYSEAYVIYREAAAYWMPRSSRGMTAVVAAGSVRHPMHRADLVAVEVAQIRDIEVDAGALADAGRIFAGNAAGGDAGRMPCVDLLRRVGGKADGAAIRRRRRFAVDRLCDREHAGLGDVEDAMAVDARRPHLERGQQIVVKGLGLVEVVGADHDV